MKDPRQANALLIMAEKDLKALKSMLDRTAFDDEIFGFHVQQAVEKSPKAWPAALGASYPHSHDIRLLLAELSAQVIDVEDYWAPVEFNAFAVQFRYQSFGPADEPLEREDTLLRVIDLIERVRLGLDQP